MTSSALNNLLDFNKTKQTALETLNQASGTQPAQANKPSLSEQALKKPSEVSALANKPQNGMQNMNNNFNNNVSQTPSSNKMPSIESLKSDKKPEPAQEIKTVDQLKAEGKTSSEIKDELEQAKVKADEAATANPKKAALLDSTTEEQRKIEEEQQKLKELEAKKKAEQEKLALEKKKKSQKADLKNNPVKTPEQIQADKNKLALSEADKKRLDPTSKITDTKVDPAKKLIDRVNGVGNTSASDSKSPLASITKPAETSKPEPEAKKTDSTPGSGKQEASKIIDRDEKDKTGQERQYKGKYAGHISKSVDNSEAGLNKEDKDASKDWQEAGEELEDKPKTKEDTKKQEAETQKAQAEADQKRLSKGEEARRKEGAKGSRKKGVGARSGGRTEVGCSRSFADKRYKKTAVVQYNNESKFNTGLSKQYKESAVKPKETKTAYEEATAKAQEKAAGVSVNHLSKEAKIGSADNMLEVLQNNQGMVQQVQDTFKQGQALGRQALAQNTAGKREADRGNRDIGEGVGTILGGIAQICTGIPQLACLFTIPLGIMNIAQGAMGIAQGAQQCKQGKDEVDDGNSQIQTALGTNRKSEDYGKRGVEAADGLTGAANEIVMRLDEEGNQNESPMAKQMKELQKRKEALAKGQDPNKQQNGQVSGANAFGGQQQNGQQKSTPTANIMDGTKGGTKGGLGTNAGQEGEDEDYEDTIEQRVAAALKGGGMGRFGKFNPSPGFGGGQFGGMGNVSNRMSAVRI